MNSFHGGSWRKSSRSTDGQNCVEVANDLIGVVGVRDSKDVSGPVLAFDPAVWSTFVRGIKAGVFDL